MKSPTKFAGVALASFALTLMVGASSDAISQPMDYSSEQYRVDFMPWANRQLVFRNLDGTVIGKSKSNVKLEMLIDGNTYRAAITPTGIDVSKLLSSLSPQPGSNGSMLFSMKIMQPTTLEDGTVLPASTATKPTEVLLDSNDFYITRTLQPVDTSTASADAPAPQVAVSDRFRDTLNREGVTDATAPITTAEDMTPLPPPGEDADEDDDGSQFTPTGIVAPLGIGRMYRSHFLSSPTCSDGRRSSTLTSNFGRRGHPDRSGVCHARNGKRMSCDHQGLDIGTSMGTPVIAAAYGCFKVKKYGEGNIARTAKPLGTPIAPSDLYERGYGYTIRMTHGNEFETQYSHLSAVSPAVRWGKCVQRGEIIGYSGNGGQSTGPHLHFGVAYKRHNVDPRRYIMGTSGSFFTPSCRHLPDNSALDAEMAADRAAGGASSGGGRSSSARAGAAQ